ncbi:MAG: hypothetical protein A2451_10650 [Bdellovibrionales bacterium RIFOXYC2_FULL_39_8]|nr:MAG: hypothetical protein A2451_10650 [Bdellovibrionales bacterium RIFOXYC2_FULL_39_8]
MLLGNFVMKYQMAIGFYFLIVLAGLFVGKRHGDFCFSLYEKIKAKLFYFWRQRMGQSVVACGDSFVVIINQITFSIGGDYSLIPGNGGGDIPQYKFYTDILKKLIYYAKLYGGNFKESLSQLKKGVIKDIQFERALRKEVEGAYLQFFFISLITWFFVYMVGQSVEVKLSMLSKIFMLAMQLSGALFFALFYQRLQQLTFAPFWKFFNTIFIFQSLIGVGLSQKEIIHHAESSALTEDQRQRKFLSYLVLRLESLIFNWQRSGQPIGTELAEIQEELWFNVGQESIQFLKKLNIIKFLVVVLFYLSTYFFYLANLFSAFLIE